MEYGKSRNNNFQLNSGNNDLKLKKDYAENWSKQMVYKYKVNIEVETGNYQWK